MGIIKGTTYLSNLKKRIAPDLTHPKHRGIRMQAHHLISQDGVAISRVGNKLVQYGYEIDALENLAFLPYTLQGACHLGIQPHRGNHAIRTDPPGKRGFHLLSGKTTDEENYDDDDHPESYHVLVSREVKIVTKRLDKKCRGTPVIAEHAIKALHDLSQSILMKIYGHPNEARLTSIADHFVLGNPIGCGGVENVDEHDHTTPCPCKRNHLNNQRGPRQRQENITFPNLPRYVPKPKK